MAIADIVKYESTFPLELTHPVTGEEIGVTFHIRSMSSADVKAVDRKIMNAAYVAKTSGKTPKIESLEKQTMERVAATIAEWDWGGQELHKGEGVLEYSKENCLKAMQVDWIFEQVNKAASDIGNFT